MKVEKVTINGVNIFPFASEDQVIEYVDKHKGILVALNAGKIGRSSDVMRKMINENIGYADGMAAVMALKKKGAKNVVRIPGCELWLKIIEKKYRDSTFYLVGGSNAVIEETISRLKNDYKGINIVGYREGFIKSDGERETLINDVVEKKPDVVFVAMGTPKQELLMKEMSNRHSAIYQGLGGSFDVYTGRVERAPLWLRKLNLEGPHRVFKDPKKIKRFVLDLAVIIKIKLGIIK
ncbi:MAG: WecB/TagA/CpsF family glycosyltransferase [Flavobacteriales bacterium]|nr:WecB/TagA/CpsF family glycosyltransferase [Flavobacteriales bacterium]